jgi:hypothetical protein
LRWVLCGQEGLLAHRADLNITADEDVEGHDIVDGDRSDQRLTYSCWCGYRLVDVHDDGWSKVLLLSGWQVGVCLSLDVKQKDGIDVEQFIPMPMGQNLPLSTLRGGLKRSVLDASLWWS